MLVNQERKTRRHILSMFHAGGLEEGMNMKSANRKAIDRLSLNKEKPKVRKKHQPDTTQTFRKKEFETPEFDIDSSSMQKVS